MKTETVKFLLSFSLYVGPWNQYPKWDLKLATFIIFLITGIDLMDWKGVNLPSKILL